MAKKMILKFKYLAVITKITALILILGIPLFFFVFIYFLFFHRVNLGGNYFKQARKIFYIHYKGYEVQLEDPDIESFVVFQKSEDNLSYDNTDNYARDKDKVYYQGRILINANPNTFEIIDGVNNYSKDESLVYYDDKLINDTDIETFKSLGRSYAKDKNLVYLSGEIIVDANPQSFSIVESIKPNWWPHHFSFDDRYVFSNLKKIIGADPKTWEQIGYGYSKDRKEAYYYEESITADPMTLIAIDSTYAMDDSRAYYKGQEIIGSSPMSFEIFDNTVDYSKDKYNVFYKTNLIEGANPETFRNLSIWYSCDETHLYRDGVILIMNESDQEIWVQCKREGKSGKSATEYLESN